MDKNEKLSQSDSDLQDPTVYLWLLYYLANHYLFLRNPKSAFEYVNKAIEHTPTLIDLYTLKGKIYQLAGDAKSAARLYEEARQLDYADRALNAISACYTVKAGEVEKGQDIISIFFKDSGYEVTVHDNQCVWFEQHCGKALYRLGKY